MGETRDVEVDVTDEDVVTLSLAGFWKQDEDGVLVLTDKGNAWISDWCKKRIAEATGA